MNRDFIYARLNDHIPGEQKVALCRVAEEAAELTKEAMKALRFGINNRHPIDGPTNAEKIVAEFYDVQEALVDAGLIAPRPAAGTTLPTRESVDDMIAARINDAQDGRLDLMKALQLSLALDSVFAAALRPAPPSEDDDEPAGAAPDGGGQ